MDLGADFWICWMGFCSLVSINSLVVWSLYPGVLEAGVTSDPARSLFLSCGVWHSDEEGSGDQKQCEYEGGVLTDWKRSVGKLPIWSCAGWCRCWTSSEFLSGFAYLFFWLLSWPAAVLLNSVAHTWPVGICPWGGDSEAGRDDNGLGLLGLNWGHGRVLRQVGLIPAFLTGMAYTWAKSITF